jgi:multiple sugar transport system permease protein
VSEPLVLLPGMNCSPRLWDGVLAGLDEREVVHGELDRPTLDGCTRIGMLRRVMIPLMGPGILTAGIFVFLFAFQEYLTALVLTDTGSKTVPVFIATQLGQTLPMLQQAGAASMLLTIPVVLIAFIAQKYLVAGLSDGAVKG